MLFMQTFKIKIFSENNRGVFLSVLWVNRMSFIFIIPSNLSILRSLKRGLLCPWKCANDMSLAAFFCIAIVCFIAFSFCPQSDVSKLLSSILTIFYTWYILVIQSNDINTPSNKHPSSNKQQPWNLKNQISIQTLIQSITIYKVCLKI